VIQRRRKDSGSENAKRRRNGKLSNSRLKNQ